MNKNILYSTAILLASLALGACNSDDDDKPSDYTLETVSQTPTWQVDWSGNELLPDWQEPNPSDFENWTVMLVQLEDALKPYASKDDAMAFFVYDELRGLAQPAINASEDETDANFFLMKAFGNETGQETLEVTLKYYCSQLKQVFSRTAQMRYNVGEVYGIDEPLVPQFTLGSSKYPVVTHLVISAANLPTIDVPFAAGDLLAAFADDECRGTYTLDDNLLNAPITLPVFGRQEHEVYTLKYYNVASRRIYTFSKRF
ncbi:MAG: hypothetical protein IJP70_03110 [Bacteroidales bacterium]|nr:hypothetical protein [Bacteroidales bacterium]